MLPVRAISGIYIRKSEAHMVGRSSAIETVYISLRGLGMTLA